MSRSAFFINRLRLAAASFSALLARHWKNSFYLYLAALFTLFAILDSAVLHVTADMRQAAFDAMVRYRIVAPQPDKDIVIVDIDEASLAAMAKDYGRWPWPRQVMGEFLEQIEKQQPKAVVFDILFSDADVYNPDSDAYFDAAIAATNNTFFPMLRLDPESDALSEVKPAMIPGIERMSENALPDATVAVVLPHFPAALQSGRLGLHNIYPDADGVARQYLIFNNNYGWKLPSLPARVAKELGWPEPKAQNVLLNWRGRSFSYRYVSFSDVFTDMGSKEKKRPQDEFTNKVVVIGSTAPSLFDIKPTPMSQMHPGVEILATAIDNLKHGDYLRFPEARIPYLLLTLCIIWATAWGFYRNTGRGKIDRLFGASQFILIGISYASINLSNTYINLTGPVTVGMAFFTIARIYAAATGKALEQSMVRVAAEHEGEFNAALLLIRLDATQNILTDAVREEIRYGLEKAGSEPKSVEVLKGVQKGLWGLFENTFAISWVAVTEDSASAERVTKDIEAVIAAVPSVLRKHLAHADNAATWFVHRGRVSGGEAARASWRVMYAEGLLGWDKQQGKTS
ncbi:adenylate cyclase [Rhodocyclaceae bacterium]|nr:adenylate cyclase [Rhodocyclaceae bacterium]